jgi:hypothetical protein
MIKQRAKGIKQKTEGMLHGAERVVDYVDELAI